MIPSDQRTIQLAVNAFRRSGAFEVECVFNSKDATARIYPLGKPELAREVTLRPGPNLYNETLSTLKREAARIGAIPDSPKTLRILPPMKK